MFSAFQYSQVVWFNGEGILFDGILRYSLIEWIFSDMEF